MTPGLLWYCPRVAEMKGRPHGEAEDRKETVGCFLSKDVHLIF